MSKRDIKRRGIDITRESSERAFLVTVDTRRGADGWSAEDSQHELAQLTATAGAEVVGQLIQRLAIPHRSHYLGEGKLAELVALKDSTDYNIVIFDDELSPLQQRKLEDILKVKIIDRVALILDIFSRRAQTREGKLQVELAQHEYLYPRLAGQWSHLERLGGGIGTSPHHGGNHPAPAGSPSSAPPSSSDAAGNPTHRGARGACGVDRVMV